MSSEVETTRRLVAAAAHGGYRLDELHPPEPLVGGASPRQYWRCWFIGVERPIVATVAPASSGPTEHGAMAGDELVRWVSMRHGLASRGVPVPEVLADPYDGILFVEDLGDVRVFELWEGGDDAARVELYAKAASLLVEFQARTSDMRVATELGPETMMAELEEFRTMGLELRHGYLMTPAERTVWDEAVAAIVAPLCAARPVLAHRDFQSQNIMCPDRGLVLIDFQDAFMAPAAYDWVALLRDSYIDLPIDLRHELLQLTTPEVRDLFPFQTLQRKLKDAGRFVTLAERGKPSFLQWYPRTIRYVEEALLATDVAPRLLDLLRTRIPELGAHRPSEDE